MATHAFRNARNFGIENAKFSKTNKGPLTFSANTYNDSVTHNHVVGGSHGPATLYVRASLPPSAPASQPPAPPQNQERNGRDYSEDDYYFTSSAPTSPRGHQQSQPPPFQNQGSYAPSQEHRGYSAPGFEEHQPQRSKPSDEVIDYLSDMDPSFDIQRPLSPTHMRGSPPASSQVHEGSRTPPTFGRQGETQPPRSSYPHYPSPFLSPVAYYCCKGLPRGTEALNAQNLSPLRPLQDTATFSPFSRSRMAGKSHSVPSSPQERLSDLLDRPASAVPPGNGDGAAGPVRPNPHSPGPYAYASAPAANLYPFPNGPPVCTPALPTAHAPKSPLGRSSPLRDDSREHRPRYPEFTRASGPQASNTHTGRSDDRPPSPHGGEHTPQAQGFSEPTFSRRNTPANITTDLPDRPLPVSGELWRRDRGLYAPPTSPKGYLEIDSVPETHCQFALPIPAFQADGRASLAGMLQCSIQGEAKIRLVLC